MAVKWVKSIRKATKAQVEAEQAKLRAQLAEREADYQRRLTQETAGLHQRLSDLQVRFAEDKFEFQKDQIQLRQDKHFLEEDLDRQQKEFNKLQKQWNDLEAFDGKLWQRPNMDKVPPLMPLGVRKTRFVAVMNLKGGVGKTTLTANAGVALARRGHRVLLVDLDFQGSLTRLCLTPDDQKHVLAHGRLSDRLLEGNGEPGQFRELPHRITSVALDKGVCDVICAGNSLAEAEFKAEARWLVKNVPDARYLFRQTFHTDEFVDRYEWVFFDCPPRLTTACVNALACSDFLLVPVLLEQGSVTALPHTLGWLRELAHVTQARLLGVVANRGELYKDQLVAQQRTIFDLNVPETIARAGFDKNSVFRSFVRNSRNKIESAANSGRIAAAEDDGLSLFESVVNEIEKGARS